MTPDCWLNCQPPLRSDWPLKVPPTKNPEADPLGCLFFFLHHCIYMNMAPSAPFLLEPGKSMLYIILHLWVVCTLRYWAQSPVGLCMLPTYRSHSGFTVQFSSNFISIVFCFLSPLKFSLLSYYIYNVFTYSTKFRSVRCATLVSHRTGLVSRFDC